MKAQNKQSGFSLLAGLVLFVVVTGVGYAGWHIWKNNKATDDTTSNNSQRTIKEEKVDPTADWVSYSDAEGKFSFKYPREWVTAANPEQCAHGLFMLGATDGAVGVCNSDNFGQMTITWRNDRTFCGDLQSEVWQQNAKESVEVSGVQGTKIQATVKQTSPGLTTLPLGAKETQYCFIANDATYIAAYTQIDTYPDVLKDFNTMVTKTLTFE